MSRAFTPPDTLSGDDVRTVADVRRTVWVNGLFGLGAGTVGGMVSHLALQALQRRYVGGGGEAAAVGKPSGSGGGRGGIVGSMHKFLRALPPLGRNTFLLSLLGGGALGSFVMSTTAGKNSVHLLHPIFNAGRDEHAGKSPYQIAMSKAAQQQQHEEGKVSADRIDDEEDELDAAHHRTRSLRRKASMRRRLETGHALSDTHGGSWPHDYVGGELERDRATRRAEAWGRRQTRRRRTVRERIESGGALSDSTGGHWSTEDAESGGDERRQVEEWKW